MSSAGFSHGRDVPLSSTAWAPAAILCWGDLPSQGWGTLLNNPFRIQFHPLSSCAYYVPIGRQKWTIVSTLEEFTIYWKQMFSSLETWDVLEFQSTEALSKKKLKRDYLYGLVSLTWSTVQLRRAVCLRSVKDDLGCPGSLPYTVAMNLKFWNQKFF